MLEGNLPPCSPQVRPKICGVKWIHLHVFSDILLAEIKFIESINTVHFSPCKYKNICKYGTPKCKTASDLKVSDTGRGWKHKKSFLGTKKLQIILIPAIYIRLQETTRETSGRKGKTANLKNRLLNQKGRENCTNGKTVMITSKRE